MRKKILTPKTLIDELNETLKNLNKLFSVNIQFLNN